MNVGRYLRGEDRHVGTARTELKMDKDDRAKFEALTDERILMIGRRALDKCHGADAQHIFLAREVERVLASAPAASAEEVAALRADAERWRMASTSRNFGINDWHECGQRTIYDKLAAERIDAALAERFNKES